MHTSKYKYFSAEEAEKIEQKKAVYTRELQRLSPREKENKLKEFIIRFTYDSNKLAGVNITLRQTSLILKEGLIPKDIKSIITIKELENHQKGIIAITKYKGPLNLRFVKRLHGILLAGVDDTIAGKTRDELQRNVKIAGTTYVPPPWNAIKPELQQFFRWYKAENRKLHPLELAALLHLKLISLQLFVDGNSRLSRLLMNWILWKKGYPAVNIPIEDLEQYYDVLDKYQVEKNEKPFIGYIVKKYLEG
jgi:Fic family protein